MMSRIASVFLLLALWSVAGAMLGEQRLPAPLSVMSAAVEEARSGALWLNLAVTLWRVLAAFVLAMAAGTAIGFVMGRQDAVDRLADPWVVVLLNMPALVIIVLAYIWAGLTEAAAIGAVALNKLPNTIVTVREGARALDPDLDEMARVFAFSRSTAFRHVMLPQLAPYLAAAARTGISLIWKIVLVVELLGRPDGVGFEIGTAFQLFDLRRILAYAGTFVVLMLVIEALVLKPIEQHASRWRKRSA